MTPRPNPEEQPEDSQQLALSKDKPTILVVDDEADLRENIAEAMGTAGFAVVTAPSGAAALQVLDSTRPDLILCDIMMPDMDGFEVCRGCGRRSGCARCRW